MFVVIGAQFFKPYSVALPNWGRRSVHKCLWMGVWDKQSLGSKYEWLSMVCRCCYSRVGVLFLRRCASVCVVFKCRWGGGKYTLRAFVVVMAATAVVSYCALLLLLPTTQYYLLSLRLLGSATSNATDVKLLLLLLFSFIPIFYSVIF